MKKKLMAIFLAGALTLSLAACGAGKETTLTGMVVSVDGTVISLMEMDTSNMGGKDFAGGERPEMPEGMEGFQGFGSFDPGSFSGEMPEGGSFPQWGSGEMPGDFSMPEDFTMPADGSMPDFGGGMPGFGGGEGSGFENFASDEETTEVEIGNAHISVEINGGKESGSISNITPGTFVTVTLNGKGEATYVLITSQSLFGGGRRTMN